MLPPNLISRNVSSNILYAAYWLLMFVQIYSFRTYERDVYIDIAAIIRVSTASFIFLLLIGLFLLRSLPSLRHYGLATGQRATLVLILVLAVSSLWSVLPLTAAFRIFQLLVATFLVWYMIMSWDIDKMDDLIWKLCLPVLVSGILSGIFSPGKIALYSAGYIDWFYRFKENACGHVAAIALANSVVQFIWKPAHLRYSSCFFRLTFAAIGLILFRSGTGWFLIQFAILLIIIKSRRIFLLFGALSIIIGTLMFVSPLELASIGLGGKNPENISTLTGRMNLYPVAIQYALESPIWGYGFLSDSQLGKFDKAIGWLAQNAHSGFLSAFMNFGIIGLLFLIAAFMYIYNGLKFFKKTESIFRFPLLLFRFQLAFVMLAVGNMVESWIGDKFTLLWPFFAALAVLPSFANKMEKEPSTGIPT